MIDPTLELLKLLHPIVDADVLKEVIRLIDQVAIEAHDKGVRDEIEMRERAEIGGEVCP